MKTRSDFVSNSSSSSFMLVTTDKKVKTFFDKSACAVKDTFEYVAINIKDLPEYLVEKLYKNCASGLDDETTSNTRKIVYEHGFFNLSNNTDIYYYDYEKFVQYWIGNEINDQQQKLLRKSIVALLFTNCVDYYTFEMMGDTGCDPEAVIQAFCKKHKLKYKTATTTL